MVQKPLKRLNPILLFRVGFWPLVFIFLVTGICLGRYVLIPLAIKLMFFPGAILLWLYAQKAPSFSYWLLLTVAATFLVKPNNIIVLDKSADLVFYVEEVKGNVDIGFKAIVLSKIGRYYLYSNLPLYRGEVVCFRTNLKSLTPAKNPGEFCFASYLKRQDLAGTAELNWEWQIKKRKETLPSQFFKLLFILREKASLRFSPLKTAELYSALILGKSMETELAKIAQDAGTSHFLVVSGLHIGYMAAIINKLPLKLGPYVTIAILFLYAFIVGSTPSVWRALISYLLARRYSSRLLDRLFLTLSTMLVVKPRWLFSLSFQYSALAVLGIALLENWPFWGPLKVGIGAFGMVLPLSILKNNKLNLVSLLGNLLLGPCVGMMMILALIYLVTPCYILRLLLDYLGTGFIKANSFLARFARPVAGFNWPQALLFWGFWFYLWHEGRLIPQKRLFLKRAYTLFLLCCVLFCWYNLKEAVSPVELYFLQVLDGDAAVLRMPYGKTVLVDTGSKTKNYTCAERIINPALLGMGVKEVKTVYLSHSHLDHIGGLEDLVFCDKIKIGFELWSQKNNLAKKAPVELAKDEDYPYGIKIKIVDLGQEKGEPNNNSLVQIVEVLGWRVLFTGDRELEGLESLEAIAVDVVKVPHHGSPNSLHQRWMEGTKASLAVFTGGKANRPHPKAIEAWRELTGRVCITKKEGAIRLRFYPERIQVASFQNGSFQTKFILEREQKLKAGGVQKLWAKLQKDSFCYWEKMNIYLRKISKSCYKALKK